MLFIFISFILSEEYDCTSCQNYFKSMEGKQKLTPSEIEDSRKTIPTICHYSTSTDPMSIKDCSKRWNLFYDYYNKLVDPSSASSARKSLCVEYEYCTSSILSTIFIILIVLLLIGGGGYYYFFIYTKTGEKWIGVQ